MREFKMAGCLGVLTTLVLWRILVGFLSLIDNPLVPESGTFINKFVISGVLLSCIWIIVLFNCNYDSEKKDPEVFMSLVGIFSSIMSACLISLEGVISYLLIPLLGVFVFLYGMPEKCFYIIEKNSHPEYVQEYPTKIHAFNFFAILIGMYYMKEYVWVTYSIIVVSAVYFLWLWINSVRPPSTQPQTV